MCCEKFSDMMGRLFPCEKKKDFTVLHTPFLYPDGDCVSLYIESKQNGTLTVSDFGETARWLRSNTPSQKRTPKQNLIIQDICLTHSVEFTHGVLQVSGIREAEVSEAVFRVAQAVIRVSDMAFWSESATSSTMIDVA
jgi:hypothetical protein